MVVCWFNNGLQRRRQNHYNALLDGRSDTRGGAGDPARTARYALRSAAGRAYFTTESYFGGNHRRAQGMAARGRATEVRAALRHREALRSRGHLV